MQSFLFSICAKGFVYTYYLAIFAPANKLY
ncbi:hypothetical protein C8N37_101495 [Sphingobacterium faecium]|nr:hypothetical protein C8N37_101495 [Sphingobacterium faecium]